jgi:hypothetical protein
MRWVNWVFFLLIVAIAATGAVIWLTPGTASAPVAGHERPPPRPAGRIAAAAQIAEMQAEASRACRCDRGRGGGQDDACWAQFHSLRDRFAHSEMATACAEESVAMTCFDDGSERADSFMPDNPARCVTTQFPYGGCDDAESRRRETGARARRHSGCSG